MKRTNHQENLEKENTEKVEKDPPTEYEDATMMVCQKKNGGEWETVEVTYRRKKKEETTVRSKTKTKIVGA